MTRRSPLLTLLYACSAIALVIILVSHPETSFEAAIRGLEVWWEVVFPSTLPFIVLSEILMGVGVVHFAGVLLEPLMRPLFNVPGTGGFVLTMGFASGYPVAAKLTTRLREQGSITKAEGERLVSFTTTGDPLFVIGAVAIGFFHSELFGFVLAFSHYVSALLLGVLYRFYSPFSPATKPLEKNHLPLPLRALQAMHRARLRDRRPFGKLMGEAVQSALHTLLMIGGFIIVFSVLLQLFATIELTRFLSSLLAVFLGPLGVPSAFSSGIIAGLFEVTLGAQGISEVSSGVPMIWKAVVASAIVSWGGISVHAQVASILSETDIRVAPYLMARALHAALASLLAFFCWKPITASSWFAGKDVPVFMPTTSSGVPAGNWWDSLLHSSLAAFAILLVLIILSLCFRAVRKQRSK
ncbi:sporulation integral membrane protein YlbJ [Brevibacillus composti]|uniref:Sporulation integral membrane protein YlbJ n=1 Tax=Brevibacillus composti TaxID=2796470 RepID=A0A7T5ENY7_9BACL|nr:sporulation integral membrane protein YlbJ [Brevibacillus composti]QQE76071.1 sporulation integral membrane protein YlbJ [Brevibacillus composti]QUO43099.1 sporulation integral membrane protein YlbJ [Brevibacillus composti]